MYVGMCFVKNDEKWDDILEKEIEKWEVGEDVGLCVYGKRELFLDAEK